MCPIHAECVDPAVEEGAQLALDKGRQAPVIDIELGQEGLEVLLKNPVEDSALGFAAKIALPPRLHCFESSAHACTPPR
jgi:hypothetical protein